MPRRHDSSRQSGSSFAASDLVRDVKALNSSVLLISQKIKYLVRNEKILGRNLIVLNKKLKHLETSSSPSTVASASPGESSYEFRNLADEVASIKERLNNSSRQFSELKSMVESMKQDFVSEEKFQEMKYVIDAINPLEFVTLNQLNELLEKKKPAKPATKSSKKAKPKKKKKK